MGSLRRLLPSRVRGAMFLVLAGTGVLGCRTCPKDDPPPVQDAPCQSRECYPAVEAATADGLAASLAASSAIPPACPRPLQVLALSGGVAGAPYTAGVLVGWTEAGTRPMFDVVSGISSGSLIGGFAFLGPRYDPELRRLILNLKTSDLFKFRPLSCMLCDGAFGSAGPAKKLIRQVFHDEFLADLRQAHAEGRRFFIGTMSLQTKRLVTWDIGAIASSGRPDADELVRKVLLAAISWPGAFPPVKFDVEVNGHCYHELHCDAGAAAMTFVRFGALPGCPGRCTPIRLGSLAGSQLYVLASRKLYSDPEPVSEHALCRLGLSVSAIFEALTRADIARLYSFCALSGMRFHLLALPADYHGKPPSFKCLYPREASQLFEMGHQMGVKGPCWRHTPPGAEPGEEAVPRDGAHIKP
ncbi:MAG TPA: patatin-like phospholipase family protein [Gemmataceae bacterium]